jgi:hypothetical protein
MAANTTSHRLPHYSSTSPIWERDGWAKTGLFYTCPDQDLRQLEAADPWAGRMGYKKAKCRSAFCSLSRIMRLQSAFLHGPAIPSAYVAPVPPGVCLLHTSTSVTAASTASHRLPHYSSTSPIWETEGWAKTGLFYACTDQDLRQLEAADPL